MMIFADFTYESLPWTIFKDRRLRVEREHDGEGGYHVASGASFAPSFHLKGHERSESIRNPLCLRRCKRSSASLSTKNISSLFI